MQILQYKKEFCQELIDHMATGLSYETFAAEKNVCRQTLYEWEKHFPEWVEAKKIAMDKAFAKWEKMLIQKTSGEKKEYDMTGLIFGLKTRFHKHYGEKIQHSVDENQNTIKLAYNLEKKENDPKAGS